MNDVTEDRNAARKELNGNVPTISTYVNCITPVKNTTKRYALMGSLRSAKDCIRFMGIIDDILAFDFLLTLQFPGSLRQCSKDLPRYLMKSTVTSKWFSIQCM